MLIEDGAKKDKKLRDVFRRKHKTENPNCFDPKAHKTVFEKILMTPNSANDIKWCVENGANLYEVSLSSEAFKSSVR